jgi:ribonuclease I
MKHGSCFTTDAPSYFHAVLGVLGKLQKQTKAANDLLQQASVAGIQSASLAEVYAPYSVQLLCDGYDPSNNASVGRFLELRTCWNRTQDFSPSHADADHLIQIDCPSHAIGTPCPAVITSAAGSLSEPGNGMVVL